jgi:hypothetical protein
MVRWWLVFGVGLLACGEVMSAPTNEAGLEGKSVSSPVAEASASSAPTLSPVPTSSPAPSSASSAPQTDAGCAIEHDNGVGQVYLSCAALGTIDEDTATRACRAYVDAGGATSCALVTLKTSTGDDCRGVAIVSVGGGATCTWSFGGSFSGRVVAYGAGWGCPKATSPTWN